MVTETTGENTNETTTSAEADVPVRPDWFGWDWPAVPARWGRMFEGRLPDFLDFGRDETTMRVEQFEDDGDLVVRGELPGFDSDDIDVTVDRGRLRISAHREHKEEHRDDDSYRSEFRYGSFERSVMLPGDVDTDDVKATYTDGILEVRVPMGAAETTARTVPIAHH